MKKWAYLLLKGGENSNPAYPQELLPFSCIPFSLIFNLVIPTRALKLCMPRLDTRAHACSTALRTLK